jgi:hypothetical protein
MHKEVLIKRLGFEKMSRCWARASQEFKNEVIEGLKDSLGEKGRFEGLRQDPLISIGLTLLFSFLLSS